VEHPFDWLLTANRRSWNDAVGIEHLYEQPNTAGEVGMAAVPSTIGRPVLRPLVDENDRLRILADRDAGGRRRGGEPNAAARKTSARRRLGTVAAVCGLAGLWFGTGALAASPERATTTSPAVVAGVVYVVRPGDTLDSIAESLVARRDVPALVHSLARELHGDPLRPGTILRVP
jgi:hypothetical protein